MSDAANDTPTEPRDDPSSSAAQSGNVGDAIETDWLDVEAELARPVAHTNRATGSDSSRSAAKAFASRRQPSSPLIVVETAFLTSAASLIWLVNYYFPMGPILQLFFPIPIALIYLRWNSRAAWMGALVSGLLLSVLMGPVRSLMFVLPYGIMGVLLGLFWRRGANWMIAIAISSLLGSFGFFFRIWLVSLLVGDDFWLYATTQVADLVEWIFVRLGLLIQPSLWQIQTAIVGMVLFNNMLYLFVVHLVALFLLDRLGNPIPRPPKWVEVILDYE
jgi:uncharacterized protein YybS (DUF2232 family)